MRETSATDAARNFAELLDAVEHRGESVIIVRRGRAVARIEPVTSGPGVKVKSLLRRHPADAEWRISLREVRDIVTAKERF